MKSRMLAALGLVTASALALTACGSGAAPQGSTVDPSAEQTLSLFTDSDVNVQKLWSDTLIPEFQKAHPNIKLQLSNADPSTATTQLAKLAASVKANQAPPMDVIVDAGFLPDADSAELLTPLSTENVPNLANVNPTIIPGTGQLPYRGSAVVLAYNSTKITTPPATFDDVVTWVKANPGRFTYNSPSTGGSGQGFVQAALESQMSAEQIDSFVTGYPPVEEQAAWDAGLDVLAELTPSVYQKTYPNGNQASLNLLASGAIDMTSTWSDMYLSSVADGTLSADIKAASISGPELPGGVSSVAITRNSAHQEAALLLLDWMLEPEQQAAIATAISGYPTIQMDKLPAEDQKRFEGMETEKLAPFFSAKSAADMSNAWQKRVP